MRAPRRVVIATRSPHKLAELAALLHLDRAELVSLAELGVEGDPVEDGLSFEANARLKARFYARLTGLPVIADDSGIEVGALGGAPGVRTRRYAGETATDLQNNTKLLAALAGLPPSARGARYVCVLSFIDPGAAGQRGGLPIAAEARGTLRGRIAAEPRGTGGFGYDPIFEPQGVAPGGEPWASSRRPRRPASRIAPGRLAGLVLD